MGMIAAIKRVEGEPPCVVYWVGRHRFSVRIVTYCEETINAADEGTIQIPDVAEVCKRCEAKLKLAYDSELAKRANTEASR